MRRRIAALLAVVSLGTGLSLAGTSSAGAWTSGVYVTSVTWPIQNFTPTFQKTYDPNYFDLQGTLSDINHPNNCDFMAGWYVDGGGTLRMGAAGYFYQCQTPLVSSTETYVTSIYAGTTLTIQGYYRSYDRVLAKY